MKKSRKQKGGNSLCKHFNINCKHGHYHGHHGGGTTVNVALSPGKYDNSIKHPELDKQAAFYLPRERDPAAPYLFNGGKKSRKLKGGLSSQLIPLGLLTGVLASRKKRKYKKRKTKRKNKQKQVKLPIQEIRLPVKLPISRPM
jgi:hypothetical protein